MFDFYITIANPDIGPQLKQIKERLDIMPTQADFDTAFEDMQTTLTKALDTEIQQVLDALNAAGGVPQSAIDKINAFRDSFKTKIENVVVPPTP